METKACQNCKQNFNIEQDDKSYYEKIKVPSPTWCPKCRAERRLSFVNVWSIFWRNCYKCGKKTMSAYPQDQNITVYCQSCWWGDSWDGTEYAMDYDSSRPFLEQVKELADKTPVQKVRQNHAAWTGPRHRKKGPSTRQPPLPSCLRSRVRLLQAVPGEQRSGA